MEKRTRVGIRGLGLLGSRIARAVHLSSDMDLTVGVAIPDKALDEIIKRAEFHHATRQALPQKMYLAVPRHIGKESDFVRKYNTSQSIIKFEGASQLCWRKQCDCIVDTAYPAGKDDAVVRQYATFPGRILVQDGASPEGSLIAPPVVPTCKSNRTPGILYRMADCILSGVVPLIHAFEGRASEVCLSMLTQYNGREPDYLIAERSGAVYVREDVRQKVQDDISVLFPKIDINVQAVIQIPSLLHYQGTLTMRLSPSITREDAINVLSCMPRIVVLPKGIMSTYQVNLARGAQDSLRPVMVFSDSVETKPDANGAILRIVFAIYYRTVAVLSNLDAIRILCGEDTHRTPLDTMRR
ncbi:hypothetical protein HYV71_03145, partial [Candidatus Uhrbacteria bacterium]|nr:hypothetical protein [Candidatus Uhrbacteria bacterium]